MLFLLPDASPLLCAASLCGVLLLSCQVLSNPLPPHGLQHARLPCPSQSPGACPSYCQLNQGCYPTISACLASFSSCLQSFPVSGSFPISWLFASGGGSIRVSTSAPVLPMNIQRWFPLGWTGWISLMYKEVSICMYIYAYILFHILFHYGLSRILNIVPWLSSRTLLFNHLTCNNLPLVTTQAFKDSLEYIKWFLDRISVKNMMIIPHQDLGWMVI